MGVCVSVCERLFRGGGCLLALSSHCALTMAGLSGAMDSGTTGRGSSLGGSVGSLDEPVSETILRDWNKIYVKLRVVLRPQSNQEETLRELRQWDLWGPSRRLGARPARRPSSATMSSWLGCNI